MTQDTFYPSENGTSAHPLTENRISIEPVEHQGMGIPRHTEEMIRRLSDAEGDHHEAVTALATADAIAGQKGARAAAERRLASGLRQKRSAEERYRDATRRSDYEELTVVAERRPMGLAAIITLSMLIITLLSSFTAELLSASWWIWSTNAMGITAYWQALFFVCTPASFGIAGVFGTKLFPVALRKRIPLVVASLMSVAFICLVASFSFEMVAMAADADLPLGEAVVRVTANGPRWSGLMLFGSLLTMMPGTIYLGHLGSHAFLRRYEVHKTNPAYEAAKVDIETAKNAILHGEGIVASAEKELAALDSEVEAKVATARSLYKSLIYAGKILSIVLFLVVTVGAEHRAVVISKYLPEKVRAVVFSRILEDAGRLATDAAAGDTITVLSFSNGEVIATLRAVPGVSRIRKDALLSPLRRVKAFLEDEPGPLLDDGRGHLPKTVQVVSQLRPAPSHVCVIGSPLFIGEGEDVAYSMKDGWVPNDACFIQEPAENLWSTRGRETSLQNQKWHFACAVGKNRLDVDFANFKMVERFLAGYLSLEGATLVTFQPSVDAPYQAARDGLSDPLIKSLEFEFTGPAAMVRMIQTIDGVEKRQTIEKKVLKPHDNAPALRGANIDRRRVLFINLSDDEEARSIPIPDLLQERGMIVVRKANPLPELEEFGRILDQSDQLWLISSTDPERLPWEHVGAMAERWRQGRLGIYLGADNFPHTHNAERALGAIVEGAKLEGNYRGLQFLTARAGSGPGLVPGSRLLKGIRTPIFEGTTISHLVAPRTEPVAFASDGNVLLATYQSGRSSSLVIHCAFTSFFVRFMGTGEQQLAINISDFLASGNISVEIPSEGVTPGNQ